MSDRILAEAAVARLLEYVGEEPKREGLVETPRRMAQALRQMTAGYGENPHQYLEKTFDETSDQLIMVTGIPFNSLCEHHVLPFSGVVSVGYLPREKIVGLSKIPRVVQAYAKRLQVQERLTQQIAQTIEDVLNPLFVGVLVEAHHTCMSLRGVRSQGMMTTSAVHGELRDELKAEFIHLATK